MAFHYPQGVLGWSVFSIGVLIVTYRLHGIDAPRTWVEWVERRFTYSIALRFVGAILILATTIPWYLSNLTGVLGLMFIIGASVVAMAGVSLLIFQNHARSLILATAESSDTMIRITSIIFTLAGLGYMIAPFLL